MISKSRMIKITVFSILLFLALSAFCSVFRFKYKDGGLEIETVRRFYELPKNSLDVLAVGSSHVFHGINPAVLFSEYGIAAFVLAGAGQPHWNSYFNLQEVLKTQRPKVVVLDAYCTADARIYTTALIENTYGMRPSLLYLDAIKESVPKEEFWNYFLKYTRYHSRYTDISRGDFLLARDFPVGVLNPGDNSLKDTKGFIGITHHQAFAMPELEVVTSRSPMPAAKTELYYRKIIELCAAKNISLEIIVVPYVVPAGDQVVFNTASDIAAEYGVSFDNYNNKYDEIDFDFGMDMADWSHANYRGASKITSYLGKRLKEKYSLADHRNDPRYASWQRDADYFWQSVNNQRLKEYSDFDTYLEKINSNPHYTLLLQSTGEQGMDILSRFAVVGWTTDLITIKQGEILSYFNAASPRPFIQLGSVMVSLDRANNTLINGNAVGKNQNGLNLLVYDALTDTIADNVTFDVNNNFAVVHQ